MLGGGNKYMLIISTTQEIVGFILDIVYASPHRTLYDLRRFAQGVCCTFVRKASHRTYLIVKICFVYADLYDWLSGNFSLGKLLKI